MTIFWSVLACGVAFGGLVGARPLTRRAGLTDTDILQFALTLEHLEAAFYKQGFEKFPASDFEALGLDQAAIEGLTAIGETEATHVTALTATIKGLNDGTVPVEPCTYDFKLTDAASMVQTARILEAVGISAYLGAAPLVSNKEILSAAASIVTVESRHQTFIRTALGSKPVPQAFDAAVGPRQIFTLAASFITKCPEVSNLGITAFAPLNVLDAGSIRSGSTLKMTVPIDAASEAALSCSFTTGDGGLQFAPFQDGGCVVPDGLGGETFLTVTTEAEGAKALSDDKIVAGPAVIVLS